MLHLKKVHVVAEKNSVFDFLYIDWGRISSLVAQMDEMGVLEGITDTASKDSSEISSTSGKGKASVAVVEAEGEQKFSKRTGRSRGQSKTFNARFSLPINFLDLLTDNDLIHKSQEEWSIGRIGMFKGTMTIADMTALLPGMKSSSQDTNAQLAVNILSEMPPTAQGIITKGGTKIWAVYDIENWVTHPTSLALAHGAKLDGQWVIIGIVDAKPSKTRKKANSGLFSTAMAAMVDFSEVLRQEIGRPENCFSFTPLLVFREVK